MPDSVQGWGGGASVSHQIGVGERCKLSQRGLGQSVSKGGCANPPGARNYVSRWGGGYQL